MHLTHNAIEAMPNRERAALINCLSGYKSANLIGTVDADGNTNLAIVSSVVHLGSHPPLLAFIIRPGGDERHTLANLLNNGHFSINHVQEEMIERAHQTAARYPAQISEFEKTNLTPAWWDGFEAPLVAQASIKMALALRDHQELEINGTHLVIGEILAVEFPDTALRLDSSLDLTRAGTVALSGLDSYYRPSLLKRMAYAKPDLPPRRLDQFNAKSPQSLQSAIHATLSSQAQCALATTHGEGPQQHLMGYAFNDSLTCIYLVSDRHTAKARNLLANPKAALLWDNRTGNTADHGAGLALSAQGTAYPQQGWYRAHAKFKLLARNPELRPLLDNPDAMLFAVAVNQFSLVQGYSNVASYDPNVSKGIGRTQSQIA